LWHSTPGGLRMNHEPHNGPGTLSSARSWRLREWPSIVGDRRGGRGGRRCITHRLRSAGLFPVLTKWLERMDTCEEPSPSSCRRGYDPLASPRDGPKGVVQTSRVVVSASRSRSFGAGLGRGMCSLVVRATQRRLHDVHRDHAIGLLHTVVFLHRIRKEFFL
jgi:hypothetical protein